MIRKKREIYINIYAIVYEYLVGLTKICEKKKVGLENKIVQENEKLSQHHLY